MLLIVLILRLYFFLFLPLEHMCQNSVLRVHFRHTNNNLVILNAFNMNHLLLTQQQIIQRNLSIVTLKALTSDHHLGAFLVSLLGCRTRAGSGASCTTGAVFGSGRATSDSASKAASAPLAVIDLAAGVGSHSESANARSTSLSS